MKNNYSIPQTAVVSIVTTNLLIGSIISTPLNGNVNNGSESGITGG